MPKKTGLPTEPEAAGGEAPKRRGRKIQPPTLTITEELAEEIADVAYRAGLSESFVRGLVSDHVVLAVRGQVAAMALDYVAGRLKPGSPATP